MTEAQNDRTHVQSITRITAVPVCSQWLQVPRFAEKTEVENSREPTQKTRNRTIERAIVETNQVHAPGSTTHCEPQHRDEAIAWHACEPMQ